MTLRRAFGWFAVLGLAAILALWFPEHSSATVQGGPALQLPWPSGISHNINYGNTYNCGDHDLVTANDAYGDNADYYAIDFALTYEPVSASASGTVRTASDLNDGYGRKVVIDHPGAGGYFSVYAHLDSTPLRPGDSVIQGQFIGTSGSTGIGTGPHLHFQLQSGLNAAIPEPLSGISSFGQYCNAYSPFWMSRPPWQPEYAYQNYGSLWGGVSESATASALDMSQSKFVALSRVNASAGGVAQWRQWNYNGGGSGWNNWTTISGLTGINGKLAMSNHRNGSQEQLHVAAVKNGDVWYTSKVGTGAWSAWIPLGRPGGTINGAVAVSNSSGGRVIVAAISNGEVYTRLKYGGSWGGWVDAGGGNTLTGSLAITTRPNGLYHMAALRYDNRVFVTCSTTGATWTWGWSDVTPPPPANSMTDSVAVDNDAASPIGGCPQFAPPQPGVVVLAFSSAVAYVRCWELYCNGWEWIGGAVGGPVAISNAVNPYDGNVRWIDVAVRSADNELHRNRVY